MEVFFVIPGEPKTKQRPRFANGRVYTPSETRNEEARIKSIYLAKSGGKSFSGDLEVVLEFFLGSRRRKDLDNMEKIVLDALNKVAYEDDSQIVIKKSQKLYNFGGKLQTNVLIREIDPGFLDGDLRIL